MSSGYEANGDPVYNNRIADLRTQLSGLIVENEALDSLIDVTQSAIAENHIPDSTALAQNDTGKIESLMVADTNMILLTTEAAFADTFDLVLVDPVPPADSLASIPASDTVTISNTLSAVADSKEASKPALEDSLHSNTNVRKESMDLLTGNAVVVVPVVPKAAKDSATDGGDKDIAILQARVKALEDSLNRKTVVDTDSKELSKGRSVVVPVVNHTVQDTVSANKPAAKEEVVLLQERIRTLEDSLRDNAAAGKNKNVVPVAVPANTISEPPTDTAKYKADAGKASKNQPPAADDEVSRLRTQLADLQKEKDDLMQQMNNTNAVPVSAPEKTNLISGNESAATQEDINALKSEIQSLKNTIRTNGGNNSSVTPQRSILPPIVPAIGIGVGKNKVVERVVEHDTVFVERPLDTTTHIDTVRLRDTIMVRDTVRVSDTITQVLRDTVQQTIVKDSLVTVTNVVDKQKENLLALPPYVILFDVGKSNVKTVYRKRLDYYAEQLKKHNDLKVVITGHTDKTGSVSANLILSEKRAKSISDYLASKGVSTDAMQISSLGETEPMVEDDTKEGQSQNRRVELLFDEQ